MAASAAQRGTMASRSHLALPALAAALFAASPARADTLITPTGGRGQLIIQQVAGFRAGGITTPGAGVAEVGMLGVSYSSLSLGHVSGGGSDEYSTFGFWLVPSADFFPIDHLSIGGLIQLGITSTTFSTRATATSQPTSTGLPTTIDFTILPRVGYLFPIGTRLGVWPRIGLGYGLHEYASFANPAAPATTLSGFLVDLDTTVLYRFNETFFASVTPEFSLLPGTASTGNVSVTATDVQFALTAGIGVLL
jgi:hypothetical protein